MRVPASPRRACRAPPAAASFGAMTRLPLHRPALLLPTLALALAGCSQPAPPADNAKLASGEPLATRAVMIGTEGPSLPACSRISRVEDGGTDRSEEHTSELQSLMRISYAVSCLT